MMKHSLLTLSAMFATALFVSPAWASQADTEEKVANVSVSQFDKPLVQRAGKSVQSKQALLQQLKGKSRKDGFIPNQNVWIFDSWVTLDFDEDLDGFYSEFSVEFDVDSVYAHVPVYAIVYLGRNDLFDAIHVSDNFDIYGESSADSLIVESELVSGFVPADYEIMIEIYDAFDDTLLAYTDGIEDVDLAYVSLESKTFEERFSDTVVIVVEHGGSLGWGLAGVLGLLWFRRFKG